MPGRAVIYYFEDSFELNVRKPVAGVLRLEESSP